MYRNKREQAEKEERKMDATMNQTRPCTISESIMQSCIEVKKCGREKSRNIL